jgi:hypothetical protein
MSHHARLVDPNRPDRLRNTRHLRRTEAATAAAPTAPGRPDPLRDPAELLRLVAPIVLALPAGQMMPLWMTLVGAMDPSKGQRGLVVASEDLGAYEAIGVTLAERYFGDGLPALFVCASAGPGLKVLPAIWAAQWRRPFVLITGECSSKAERGTVQDSRGVHGPSLVKVTAPLTASANGEPGSFDVTDPTSAWAELLGAPRLAIERQKAVHLNIPVDIQAAIFGAKP